MRKHRLLLAIVIFLIVLPLASAVTYPEGLMYYYKMNNESSNGQNAFNSIDGLNNGSGTSITGSEWVASVNTTFNKSIDLDGSNDYFTLNFTLPATTMTIQMIMYSDTTGSERTAFSSQNGADSSGVILRQSATDSLNVFMGTGATYIQGVTSLSKILGGWNYITAIFNASGVFVFNGSTSIGTNTGGSYAVGTSNSYIGLPTAGGLKWSGKIDEVRIWNFSLLPSNMTDFWSGELDRGVSPPPNLAPAISINTPANNTITTDTTPTFNFKVIDDTATSLECDLLLNDSVKDSYTTTNNTNTDLTSTALTDGSYNWKVNCSDGVNMNTSEIRSITIDTTTPTINLITPDNHEITNNNSLTFYYWAEVSGLNNCGIYLNQTLNITNSTPPKNDQKLERVYYNLTEKSAYYTPYTEIDFINFAGYNSVYVVNATDNLRLSNGDETTNLRYVFNYLDGTNNSNLSTLSNPADVVYHTFIKTNPEPSKAVSNISIQASGDSANQKNTTINYYHNTSTFYINDIDEGGYNWSVKCYDNVGNLGSSSDRFLRIDTTSPYVSSYSPLNNSEYSYLENISFSLLVSDLNFIYSVRSNITNSTGHIFLTLNYTDTTGANYTSVALNNTYLLGQNGTFTWSKRVCDGHTATEINDKIKTPITSNGEINFIDFKLTPKDPYNIIETKTEKLIDKYIFEWDLKEIKKTEIEITSDYIIDYFPNSEYKGHFILRDREIWVDFEGLDNLKITKINDKKYIIETTPTTTEIKAKSVGALNCFDHVTTFDTSFTGIEIIAKRFGLNTNISTFNATILELGLTKNTTNGKINFNLTEGGNYTIRIFGVSGYAERNESVTISGHTYLTSYLYLSNSVSVTIYDEDTGLLLNSSSVLFDGGTTYYQTHTTTNGSIYITGIPSYSYNLKVSSTNYVTRNYPAVLTGSNFVSVSAYLLNTSNAVVITIKSDDSDKFIEGAVIILSRKVNGSWSNVGTATTDGVGAVQFAMKEGEDYKLYITSTDYNTKEITLTPLESSYTIYLVRSTQQTFFTLFDKFSYRLMPYNLLIPPSSISNPITCFNLTIVSAGGYIDYFGLNATLNNTIYNISNITGSTTGGVANFCLNLTQFNGYNVSVNYWIKVNGEALWENQRQYFITNLTEGSLTEWFSVKNYSATGWLQNYGSELSVTWKIIIMVAVAVGLMLTFALWLPPAVLGFIGVATIGVFSFVWFPSYILISMIFIVIVAILYLIMEGRG